MTALAALSSFATLITFCCGWSVNSNSPWYYFAIVSGVVLGIAIIYAILLSIPKKKINLAISPGKLDIAIQQADLFEQKGIIVIGVNEYFDTHVGNGVVSPKSLHGLFINRYFHDRTDELYKKVIDSLSEQGIDPIEKDCKRRTDHGKTAKYPIGTCAKIRDGVNTYVLVALSHFDSNDKAHLERTEYNTVIGNLMNFLANNAEANEVHMPILGSGLTRLDRTPKRILYYMIDAIDFQYTPTLVGGLHIDIISLKKAGINLNYVESTFKNGIIQN